MNLIFSIKNPNFNNIFFILPIFIIWVLLIIIERKKIPWTLIKSFHYFKEALSFKINIPLVSLIAILVAFGIYLPLCYDESYTFNHFTSSKLFNSMFTYPVPNNHVFHSILSNLSWLILGWTNSELIVRLPSILFTVLTFIFVQNKYLNKNYFLTLTFLLCLLLSFNFFQYSFQARGYSMQVFFAVVSFYLLNDKFIDKKIKFFLIVIFTLFGLYTSPAYLYSGIPLILYLIISEFIFVKNNIRFFIFLSIQSLLTLILLYAPIVLYEGYKTLIDNRFVQPISDLNFNKILLHSHDILNYITYPNYFSWLVLILFLLFTFQKRNYYNIMFFVVPIMMMGLLKQLPFERVFFPIGIIIILFLFQNFEELLRPLKFRTTWLNFSFFSIMVLSIGFFIKFHKKGDLETAYSIAKIEPYLRESSKVYLYEPHWVLQEPIESWCRITNRHWVYYDDSSIKKITGNSFLFSSKKDLNLIKQDSVECIDSEFLYVYTKKYISTVK